MSSIELMNRVIALEARVAELEKRAAEPDPNGQLATYPTLEQAQEQSRKRSTLSLKAKA